MKKLLIPFISILIIGMAACSTDFDVTADWEEITIIYGLLNGIDDSQYIRIQKAFLSENTSALEIAEIGDSLYHETGGEALSAVLEEIRISNNSISRTITLEKVNASDEGINKEEGVFATNPNFLYKVNTRLDQNRSYRLIINTPRGNVVTSETPLVKDFNVFRPKTDLDINFQTDADLSWIPAENGATYGVDIYFNYIEIRNVNGEEIEETKRIKWDALTNENVCTANCISNPIREDNNGNIVATISSENFFNFIANNIGDDPNVIEREAENLDFVIWVGSERLKIYNDVAFAQFGITSSQGPSDYNSIDGIENGTGLLGSNFHKEINEVPIGGLTLDLIACGDVTGHLRFKRDPNNPNPNCQ